MAAVFPLDTTKPWTFNGVTYEYDAAEDRWFVVSTTKTDAVDETLEELTRELDVTNTVIDQEIENRTSLLNAATNKNNQQDASLLELSGRIDTIGATVGILDFKGDYTYVLEKSQAACDAALAAALGDGMDSTEALRLHGECVDAIGTPLASGTFTSIGSLVQRDVEELIISDTDMGGESFDWENLLESGDYVEIVEKVGGDSVLYEVVADPVRSGTEERIRVKFIKETAGGNGQFDLQTVSEIRVIKASQGLNISQADLRYARRPYTVIFADDAPTTGQSADGLLVNGELWYNTRELELFVWNNNAWVTAAKPPSQDVVVADVQQKVDALMAQPKITASATSPESPDEGDIWFNTETFRFAFYAAGGWVSPDNS